MKKIILSLIIICAVTVTAFAEYPPEGWTDNVVEGIDRARKENKKLLLDFSGSDWCIWCQKLEKEIWLTPQFKEWAKDNAVTVLLDFPQSIELSRETKIQNRLLGKFFRVKGYPTVIVLDSDLSPLLQTGYREETPEEYIQHIEEDTNIRVKSNEAFVKSFTDLIDQYLR